MAWRSWSRPPGCGPTSASGAATSMTSFHIHGVTGPDEYTTVVNNNLFTNVMARFNLEQAAAAVARVRQEHPDRLRAAGPRGSALTDAEVDEWAACAEGMHIPFDEAPGHPPPGRLLPGPRGLGPVADAGRAAPAAAALPPAGDLPVPGPQAGRRRARSLPAGRPLHVEGEARRLRVLRPDHHRRLHPVRGRPVGHRRRGRLPRLGAGSTSSKRCTSTWPTCTATPSTACTSPRPAACGRRWSTGSAACATTAAVSPSTPACPRAGTPCASRSRGAGRGSASP